MNFNQSFAGEKTPEMSPAEEQSASSSIDNAAAQSYSEPAQEIEPEDLPSHIKRTDGYTLANVRAQLDGIVKNWFKFAADMDPNKKETFLALGERIAEISDLLEKDFI